MSDIDKTVWNTRERMLSTDLEREVDLVHRAVMETLAALAGDQLSGVLRGMEATAPGTGMSVNLTAGLAVLYDSTQVYPESPWRWIEQQSDTIVTIPAAHPTLDRWDVIEIAPNASVTSTQSRDIYSGTLGTFTPGSVTKEVASQPTITVRSGTAATNPALPAGTSGVIPLAYVYVAAATGTIAATDVVRCRPLVAKSNRAAYGPFLGGCVDVTASGGDTIRPRPFRAAFGDGPDIYGGGFVNIDMAASSDARVDSGLTYPPVADTLLYIYVADPPWPTGYDSTMARRELWTTGTRIASKASGVENGLVILTDSAPALTDDAQGQYSGTVAINDPAWGGATIPRAMYLGTVFYDISGGGLGEQHTNGAVVKLADAGAFPSETDTVSGGGSGGSGDFRLANTLSGTGTQRIPSAADRYGVTWKIDNSGGASGTSGDLNGNIYVYGGERDVEIDLADPSAVASISDTTWIMSDDGTYTWGHSANANGSSFTVSVMEYEDRIVAAR